MATLVRFSRLCDLGGSHDGRSRDGAKISWRDRVKRLRHLLEQIAILERPSRRDLSSGTAPQQDTARPDVPTMRRQRLFAHRWQFPLLMQPALSVDGAASV
jgi:hypothetical protein